MRRNRQAAAGFSLVETLLGLLILTLVVTTSLAIFFDRARRLQDAAEIARVWQALGNEAEARRHQPWGSLSLGEEEAFLTEPALLQALGDATASAVISAPSSGIRSIRLTIRWREGTRQASIEVIRSYTGGGPLW